MKRIIYIILCFWFSLSFAQNGDQRLLNIKHQLELVATDVPGLTENVRTEINVNNIKLSSFLLAVSEVHNVNFNISSELNNIQIIVRNFTNVSVSDLLLFLCKEYQLTIDFTGNILSIKRFEPVGEVLEERIIPVVFDPVKNTISIDAQADPLYELFKRISDESGKNLVYESGLDNLPMTLYVKATPIDVALEQLAFANQLFMKKTKDGFYRFEDNRAVTVASTNPANSKPVPQARPRRQRSGDFAFTVKDSLNNILDVDFVDVPMETIITEISAALNLDVFTASPLTDAGTVTFKARAITFDTLLIKLFESQAISSTFDKENSNQNRNRQNGSRSKRFSFKKEGTIYFFGTENQLSLREIAIVHLQHRSVELLADPQGGMSSRSAGRSFNNATNAFNNRGVNQNDNVLSSNRNRDQLNTNQTGNFNAYTSQAEALVNILPDEIKQDLDIKVDYELNSFYVNGPSANIARFREFIDKIDKPVPVVLIEVMILEVNRTSTVEAGVSWGIGTEPTVTQGGIYPETDLSLGATTVNKIIGSFNSFAGVNLGRVVPNFFATIKAMESNGDLKIRSTPRLSTLNGHRAYFSNGQTSYYAITDQVIVGSDNPVTQTAVNYQPIDAELGLTIKPLVSGDGQVTLDISVIQSSFGARIAEDAPPDINSREFSSLIRMKDQDLAVLGGLEEQLSNNSGSGVPFLARIPLIKWLFSKRVREGRKSRLTVLIKPTVIQ